MEDGGTAAGAGVEAGTAAGADVVSEDVVLVFATGGVDAEVSVVLDGAGAGVVVAADVVVGAGVSVGVGAAAAGAGVGAGAAVFFAWTIFKMKQGSSFEYNRINLKRIAHVMKWGD